MRRAGRCWQSHTAAALLASADERRRAVVRHGRFQLDVGKGVLTMGRGASQNLATSTSGLLTDLVP